MTREQLVESSSSFNFGRLSIEAHTGWLNSRAAFAWITSPNNTRLDQVQVGRAYERVNLTATALGLAMHPHSQLLPEYGSIIALQQEFKNYLGIPEDHTVQMFFRLGHADPVPPSPRRQVRGLLST